MPASRRIVAWLLAGALAVALYGGARLAGRRALVLRATWAATDERALVPAPRAARLLSLGYNELAADLAWARTLVYYGDGLTTRSSLTDVEPLLELVNALDPHFRRPYLWGAYATTYRAGAATQEEFRASIAVLERGLAVFPDEWEMAWLLGLRYFYDLRPEDPAERARTREIGASWMERAMRKPNAPPDLPLIASTMRTKLGQHDRALRELREMLLTTADPAARAVLEARYEALASRDASELLRAAAEEFEAARRATLPFAPPSLYVLLGPRPAPVLDLEAAVRGEEVRIED